MKLAAIDIGSNAARLQISTVLTNDTVVSFKRVEYVRFPLRLGHDVFTHGALTTESVQRTVKLMQPKSSKQRVRSPFNANMTPGAFRCARAWCRCSA